VLACVLDTSLLQLPGINRDAAIRAERYLKEIISAGSYTHSLGIPMVRNSIANFIAKADNVAVPDLGNIFLTDGASQGVHLLLQTLITNPQDSIMIPIPQYPLYSASIALHEGHACSYFLNE
jgi:alanine transaminase